MSESKPAAGKGKISWLIVGLIIGVIVGGAIGYFAAPSKVVTQTKTVTQAPKPVEITVCFPTWVTPDYWYWKNVLAPEFEGLMARQGVYVRIKFVEYPSPDNPYRMKLIADMNAGTAPDVVAIDSFWVPALASAGYLLDLTDYVKSWSGWDQFYKPMKDMVSWQGKVYAVMAGTDVRPLYYRKDILIAAGVIKPGEKWQPKTLDDLLAAARKIKAWAQAHGYEIYPIALKAGVKIGEATTMQGFYMVLLGYGGRLYDFKTGKWIGKSTALLKTLEFYYDIYVKEKLSVPPELWFTGDPIDKIHRLLADGKLAIFPTWDGVWYDTAPGGKWQITHDFRGNPATRDQVLDYTAMPGAKPGMVVTISGGWCLAVYSKAKDRGHAKLAWEFIKFVTSEKQLAIYGGLHMHFMGLPPRKDVASDPIYTACVDKYTLWRCKTLLPYTTFRPGLPAYMKVSVLVQQATEKILRGETPQQVLNWYDQQLKKIVGPDKVEELP